MGMVDIHTHILPGVDDGSKSMEMSVEMCRVAAAGGTTHIVASPHCNDRYEYDRDAHLETLQQLRHAVGDTMEFSLGCDFHFSYDNVLDLMRDPSRYTIGNTRYLLAEFSDFSIAPNMKTTLSQICAIGIVPIITHPERNRILQTQPEVIKEWIDVGCLVQVTANAITGFWGALPKKVAAGLLRDRAVHVIASDAHDPLHRSPVLSHALEAAAKIIGPEEAGFLVEDNPGAIVRGEQLPYAT
jgi:protein-tyrosine phosphatase